MRRVIIESPYRGESYADLEENLRYLRDALRDSLGRGEAPFASHAIYPGPLNDATPDERRMGIHAGYAWWSGAEVVVFYTERGVSEGMLSAARRAGELGMDIEIRGLFEIPHTDVIIAAYFAAALANGASHGAVVRMAGSAEGEVGGG